MLRSKEVSTSALMTDLKLTDMRPDDWKILLDWLWKDGWLHITLDYLTMLPKMSQMVCRALIDGTDGQLRGIIIYEWIHEDVAFVVLYAVAHEMRGCGLGKILWQDMLDHVGKATLMLEADEEMAKKYQDRSGFVVELPLKIEWYVGYSTSLYETLLSMRGTQYEVDQTISIRQANETDTVKIAQYHSSIYGREMHAFWEMYMQLSEVTMWLAEANENIRGTIAIRKDLEGLKIGSFYAESCVIADSLLKYALENHEEQPWGKPINCGCFILGSGAKYMQELVVKSSWKVEVLVKRLATRQLAGIENTHLDKIFSFTEHLVLIL